MVYDQGLAVGLAVGIPCFVVLVGATVLYLRRRRSDREEDALSAIDVELRDNNSYTEFHEALHRPYGAKAPPYSLRVPITPGGSPEKPPLGGSAHLASTQTLSDKAKAMGGAGPRTPLAYDFYDQFIPILGDSELQPPQLPPDRHSVHSGHSSPNSTSHSTPSRDPLRSLDNLAKQLQAPFFDKLPSAAALKQPPGPGPVTASLLSDMVHNVMYDRMGINDHYVNRGSIRHVNGDVDNDVNGDMDNHANAMDNHANAIETHANGDIYNRYVNDPLGSPNERNGAGYGINYNTADYDSRSADYDEELPRQRHAYHDLSR